MDVLDAVLGLGAALTAVRGLQRGFLVGACSLLAQLGGALGAAAVLPAVLRAAHWTGPAAAIGSAAAVLGVGLLAHLAALSVGTRLRARTAGRLWRWTDALLGGVTVTALFALAVAALAPAAQRLPFAPLDAQVRRSAVVGALRGTFPFAAGSLIAPFSALVSAAGFDPGPAAGLPAAAGGVAAVPAGPLLTPAVRRAAAGVVRILGEARACGQTQEGSGFVVAPQRVMTNAHVVAGVAHPTVQVGGIEPRLAATVVLFDPAVDVAVLDVPGLRGPVLPLSVRAQPVGQRAVAAGFPQDGPYTVRPATVTATVDATLPARGGPSSGSRQVFTLTARIEPGSSGGPLLSPTGSVLGVVFARSTQSPQVGYALTAAQVAPAAEAAPGLDRAVGTGGCTP